MLTKISHKRFIAVSCPYIKFNNRQKSSVMLETRILITTEGSGDWRGTPGGAGSVLFLDLGSVA